MSSDERREVAARLRALADGGSPMDGTECGGFVTKASFNKLLALADRIDAEMVELPKDAYGEYIHEHDKVDWLDHAGTWHENATVVAVCDDGCYVMDGTVFHVHKSNIRHHHEPTVVDVLREFADEMNQNLGMYTGEAIDADDWRDADAKTVEKFAAKLRLADDAE